MWPFDTPLFTEVLIPFLLVFVLVFAVLQKTKVLGDGKKQIDSLIALGVGLILIAVPKARDFITNIMPWLAVGLVVILIYLLLYGFVSSDKEGLKLEKWMKSAFAVLAIIFVVALVLVFSGFWAKITSGVNSNTWMPAIIFVIIIGVAFALITGKKE
jgi:hypothetical protein